MKRLRSSACYVPQAVKVAWIVHLVSSHLIGSCGRFYLSSSASLLAVFPSWFFSPTSTRRSRYSQAFCPFSYSSQTCILKSEFVYVLSTLTGQTACTVGAHLRAALC